MKKIFKIKSIFLLAFGIINLCSCKTDEPTSKNTVTDIDSNIYHTVEIGTQTWMVENLKTTKYNDGTAIPSISDSTEWTTITSPAYCWYKNDSILYKKNYGALYNWYAVNTGKLAPKGWHIPTNTEWETLFAYLGGEKVAGGKLKETGIKNWLNPNTKATNQSGFTALPSGSRYYGKFSNEGYLCICWCADEYFEGAFNWAIRNNTTEVTLAFSDKKSGLSVRCIKD